MYNILSERNAVVHNK